MRIQGEIYYYLAMAKMYFHVEYGNDSCSSLDSSVVLAPDDAHTSLTTVVNGSSVFRRQQVSSKCVMVEGDMPHLEVVSH